MTLDHDHIEELLAGYVLQSLDGDDAREADKLLTEHVPTCAECRTTLSDFQAMTGDLALATPAVTPPDLLWPQIKRSMGEKPIGRGRRTALWAVAASLVAIFALAGWNVILNNQVSNSLAASSRVDSFFRDMVGDNGRQMVSLENQQHKPTMLVSYLPGYPATRFVGVDIPPPAKGNVYRIWLDQGGTLTLVTQFVPMDGDAMIEASVDLTQYDGVTVTEEPAGPAGMVPTQPSGTTRWTGAIPAPSSQPVPAITP